MKIINWLMARGNLFMIVTALMGYTIVVSLTYFSPYLLWLSWQKIVTPPPEAVEVIAYNGVDVYFKTRNASLHTCDVRNYICKHDSAVPSFDPNRYFSSCGDITPTPPVLVNIVSTYALRLCRYHDALANNFVVLADGTVWLAELSSDVYWDGSFNLRYVYQQGYLGLVAGAGFGGLLLSGLWLIRFVAD